MDLDQPYSAMTAHFAIVFVVLFLIFCLLMLVLLFLDPRERTSSLHLATGNIILGHFLIGILCHPGSIRLDLFYLPLSSGYCWFWHFMIFTYFGFVPYSLITYSIERFLYIQNPNIHKQRFNRYAIAAMLILPWLVSIILSLLCHAGDPADLKMDAYRSWKENVTIDACMIPKERGEEMFSLLPMMAIMLPLIASLTLVVTVLVIWCCFKERAFMGTNYYQLGDEVRRIVRDSVIAVAVLNFVGIVTLIVNMVSFVLLPIETFIFSIYGIFQGIVWLVTIKAVREKIVNFVKRCCGLRSSGAHDAVHYEKNPTDDDETL